ncbi:hypothetical protein AMS68_004107 [Peltaster fructicola]|uniref:Uncharacterized protein n=1 Tax=Peltaster fructicola TaxID=286661 RepID=A0A6H0XVW5_9PEZI|nr:hypothetical protein AMS68_004107 [Peltaster fructicola]
MDGSHQSPRQASRPYDQQVRRDSLSGPAPAAAAYQHGIPPSPNSSRLPPPSPRDRPPSGYYDPIGEGRAGAEVRAAPYQPHSPTQSRGYEQQPPYMNGHGLPAASYPASQHQPTFPTHAHPISASDPRLPTQPYDPVRSNGMHSSNDQPPPAEPPARSSNPMSMMNILSDDPQKPQAQSPPATPHKSVAGKQSRSQTQVKEEEKHIPDPTKVPLPGSLAAPPRAPLPPQTGPPGLTWRDTEKAYADIQAQEYPDNADDPEFAQSKEQWLVATKKRTLELSIVENKRRKRRRLQLMQKWHDQFAAAADAERSAFIEAHEHEVEQEVRTKELEEDKERKKDQQRKRRREKAIADEKIKRDEAMQSLADVQDEESACVSRGHRASYQEDSRY